MNHTLDNPAWNGLLSGNAHLAYGNNEVKYFDKEVSPFVGFKENTTDHFNLLHEIIPHHKPLLFVAPAEIVIPAVWETLGCIKGLQMVHSTSVGPSLANSPITDLTDEHVPQMLSLTRLTNPGPFALRTIEFGHYKGIFENNQLAAMAGHRLKPSGYTEISAVCTHPDHTGKRYAKQLLHYYISLIRAASQIPFLHVRHDNERAIRVYEQMGFFARTEVFFYVLQKTQR